MKRYLLAVFIMLGVIVSLCSCGDHTGGGDHTDEGIYFSLSDTPSEDFYMRTEYPEYSADVEKIKLFFDRKDRKSFEYDYRYLVYVYEDDEWKKIAFDSSFMYRPGVFEIVNTDPNASDVTEMWQTISVADLNIKLKAGRYKVQKEFEDGSVYAEFTIK